MKDFAKVLVMLVLVFGFMAFTVYLNYVLNAKEMAILAAVLAVVIILVVYWNFDRWFGPRTGR